MPLVKLSELHRILLGDTTNSAVVGSKFNNLPSSIEPSQIGRLFPLSSRIMFRPIPANTILSGWKLGDSASGIGAEPGLRIPVYFLLNSNQFNIVSASRKWQILNQHIMSRLIISMTKYATINSCSSCTGKNP